MNTEYYLSGLAIPVMSIDVPISIRYGVEIFAEKGCCTDWAEKNYVFNWLSIH